MAVFEKISYDGRRIKTDIENDIKLKKMRSTKIFN